MSSETGVLGRLNELLIGVGAERGGALWNLSPAQRQLDANLIRLPAGGAVSANVEPNLDVLLFVAEGDGTLTTAAGEQPLSPGTVVWLPHGAERALAAGGEGLVYLTAHRRRPGMTIGGTRASSAATPPPAEPQGGEAACLLHLVCAECGRLATERSARYCSQCGSRLDEE